MHLLLPSQLDRANRCSFCSILTNHHYDDLVGVAAIPDRSRNRGGILDRQCQQEGLQLHYKTGHRGNGAGTKLGAQFI